MSKTKTKTPAKKKPQPAKGNGTGPVQQVWAIFSKNATAERKDVLELAVKAGVNVNTAKTQYHKWCHRGDK